MRARRRVSQRINEFSTQSTQIEESFAEDETPDGTGRSRGRRFGSCRLQYRQGRRQGVPPQAEEGLSSSVSHLATLLRELFHVRGRSLVQYRGQHRVLH